MKSETKEICKDLVGGVAKATLEQIPVINFFTSVFTNVKEGTLQRRFNGWQEMVGERLATLENAVLNSLGENDTFATVLLKATELAAKSNVKKMELLANAVKYAATNEISEDYIIIFLKCIDNYTISHFKLLKYLNNPFKVENRSYISVSPMILYCETNTIPKSEEKLLDLITKELYNDGFIDIGDLRTMMSIRGALSKRTTMIGDSFMDFFGIKEVEL